MYFFKDDSYYLFDGKKLDIEDGYPRLINTKWSFCSENILQMIPANSVPSLHSLVQHSVVNVLITLHICLYLIMRGLHS